MPAYNFEDCRTFSKALEYAWELFLKSQRLTPTNTDAEKAALTYAILHAAGEGHRSPRELALIAVARMEKYHSAIQIQRSFIVQRHQAHTG
jgi:hypothetical protein